MTPLFPDDPDAPATPEELAAAEELRAALEDPSRDHEAAALLRAASLAHAPRPLDEAEHRVLVEAAVAKMPAKREKRGGIVIRVAFGAAASAVALAAGIALFFQASEESAPPHAKVELVHVRSTQALFDEPFAKQGGTTARIDRIAMAREDDLRENRFSRWGVR